MHTRWQLKSMEEMILDCWIEHAHISFRCIEKLAAMYIYISKHIYVVPNAPRWRKCASRSRWRSPVVEATCWADSVSYLCALASVYTVTRVLCGAWLLFNYTVTIIIVVVIMILYYHMLIMSRHCTSEHRRAAILSCAPTCCRAP